MEIIRPAVRFLPPCTAGVRLGVLQATFTSVLKRLAIGSHKAVAIDPADVPLGELTVLASSRQPADPPPRQPTDMDRIRTRTDNWIDVAVAAAILLTAYSWRISAEEELITAHSARSTSTTTSTPSGLCRSYT